MQAEPTNPNPPWQEAEAPSCSHRLSQEEGVTASHSRALTPHLGLPEHLGSPSLLQGRVPLHPPSATLSALASCRAHFRSADPQLLSSVTRLRGCRDSSQAFQPSAGSSCPGRLTWAPAPHNGSFQSHSHPGKVPVEPAQCWCQSKAKLGTGSCSSQPAPACPTLLPWAAFGVPGTAG